MSGGWGRGKGAGRGGLAAAGCGWIAVGGGEGEIYGGCLGARWSASDIEVVSSIITKSRLVLVLGLKPKVAPTFIFKASHRSK